MESATALRREEALNAPAAAATPWPASVAAVAGPLSALVFWYGIKPYGQTYQRLEASAANNEVRSHA